MASRTKLRPRATAASQREALGEARRDRRRQRAARAVHRGAGDALAWEPRDGDAAALAAREAVVGRAVAMPALHERRLCARLGDEPARGLLGAASYRHVEARQRLRLGQVRRHQRGAAHQLDEPAVRAPLEQLRAVARAKHGVDHERRARLGCHREAERHGASTSSVASMPSLIACGVTSASSTRS